MNYWLDLFTWNTWQEFLAAGGDVSGFREKRWRTVQKMKEGDLLLCYMTGISRFFAILEVTGEPYYDTTPLWEEAVFPARVPVKVDLYLEPAYAVPVTTLEGALSYLGDMTRPNSWTGHFRGSPVKETTSDAKVIIAALEAAKEKPVYRDIDRRKLERKLSTYETEAGLVTVPDDSEDVQEETRKQHGEQVTHEEIQGLLLQLGAAMGLDLWVASDNRHKDFQGKNLIETRLLPSLPTQFDQATNRTIGFIDVLWLEKNAIIAAFEIEHTTAIYSGLLRMSDLIAMQPNINIQLYIVAPDDRKAKVKAEINRATFSQALRKPLSQVCRFIPYSNLQESMKQYRDILPHLKPEFLVRISESMELEDI